LVLLAQRRGRHLDSPRLPEGSDNGAKAWGWRGSRCERSRPLWVEYTEHGLGGCLKDSFMWASNEDFKSVLGLICTDREPDFDKEHWDGCCRREYAKTTFPLHSNYKWASFLLLQA